MGAARKVSHNWSQETMKCHSFNCFSIVWGQGNAPLVPNVRPNRPSAGLTLRCAQCLAHAYSYAVAAKKTSTQCWLYQKFV